MKDVMVVKFVDVNANGVATLLVDNETITAKLKCDDQNLLLQLSGTVGAIVSTNKEVENGISFVFDQENQEKIDKLLNKNDNYVFLLGG